MKNISYYLSKLQDQIHQSTKSEMIPGYIQLIINEVDISDDLENKVFQKICKKISKYVGHWDKPNMEYYILYLALREILTKNDYQ